VKLRDLFSLMEQIRIKNDISPFYICGGGARDKYISSIDKSKPLLKVEDVDLTTGDKTIHNLAIETGAELRKSYQIKQKHMDDGHISIFVGDLKIDFSSNFIIPNIDKFLVAKNIKSATDLQKETFSRDFTCNALLLTPDFKTIKDPTNMGIEDINKKLLKTCLNPDITLRLNTNRIIRAVYLSAKLDFDVAPEIITWISENKDLVRLSSDTYLKKNLDKAMAKNPERAVWLINKTSLWDVIPITNELQPFYNKRIVIAQKNFDYGQNVFENMDKYKSIGDFRKKIKKKKKVKKAYNEPNANTQTPEVNPITHGDTNDPYNQYYPPGIIDDSFNQDNDGSLSTLDGIQNRQRDGKDFKEFGEFAIKRNKRLNRIKKLKELLKEEKQDNQNGQDIVLEPHNDYSSMYGNIEGFEGVSTNSQGYYSGTIADSPDAVLNPYNTPYQSASFKNKLIK
jgi:tRNA nucleotidyltransferase/poly(A) polymerase